MPDFEEFFQSNSGTAGYTSLTSLGDQLKSANVVTGQNGASVINNVTVASSTTANPTSYIEDPYNILSAASSRLASQGKQISSNYRCNFIMI